NLNTPQFPKWSLSTFIIAGRDENFDEWSPGYIVLSQSNLSFRPTAKIRADLSYVDQRTYRPSDHSAVNLQRIPRLKLEYQLSRPVFIRFVGQYVSFERAALIDDSRTGDPIYFRNGNTYTRANPVSRNSLRGDFLFSYQPTPGTVLFAGYGSSLSDAEAFSFNNVNRTSDGFFVKFSYLFRM
ncbi:MAG TPA: hypothetical protein VM100_12400, partial [Longimicrobiales bacterium]|nr:hypothetical protein [Longimicrobiales bacterium]